MDALLAGEAHMTAPYFNMDSFYASRSRISQLGSSCTAMVRQKTYRSYFVSFDSGNL